MCIRDSSQGGFSAQCLRTVGRRASLGFASKIMSMLMSIFGRLGVHLGSLLGVMFGHVGAFSAQVGLGTVFESTYLRKSVFSRNITLSNGFWPNMTPRWGQDRPKIAPRWVQDRLGSPFYRLEFSLRFLIVLGSVLVAFYWSV